MILLCHRVVFSVLLPFWQHSISYQFDVNGFSEIQNELIDYAYDYKKKDPIGVSLSNRGGWQSEGFNIINEDDVCLLYTSPSPRD